jgi:hypothetical protein
MTVKPKPEEDTSSKAADNLRERSETLQSPEPFTGRRGGGSGDAATVDLGAGHRAKGESEPVELDEIVVKPTDTPKELEKASGGGADTGSKSSAKELEDAVGGGEE